MKDTLELWKQQKKHVTKQVEWIEEHMKNKLGTQLKTLLGTCGGIKPLHPKSSRSLFPSHCNKEKRLKLTSSHSDCLICPYSQKIK